MTALDVRPDTGPAPRQLAPGRVTFNRPPRLRPSLSTEKFEVPSPPSPLQKPSQSFTSGLIIPLVAVVAMGSLFMFGGFTQTNNTYLVLTVVALLLGSALPTAWLFFEDRRKFRVRAREQIEDHGRRLRNAELELGRLRAEEQDLRNDEDPRPADLERRAQNRGRRLFERRATDPDFLQLRLGPGLAPTRVEVSYTDQRPSDSNDLPLELLNLQREGRHIADQYRQVPDVPVRFDLRRAGAVGLAGRYQDTVALARSVLCHAAVHHSPDDLRIVGFLGSRPLEDWAWLKWLPHARNGGTGEAATSLAWDPPSRQALSRWLFDALTSRKRALEELSGGGEPLFPWLLVFVDDLRTVHADAAVRMALADGKRLRIALIGLADDLASVPGGCGGVAAVEGRGERGQVSYGESNGGLQPLQCAPDSMDVDHAERIARALAPLVVLDDSADGQSGDIPARISFFESLGIANVEQLDVDQCWQLSAIPDLLRTPLGPTAGGDLLWLDLKEQSQSGHGPHGLIAGTTGAGKSELLLTVIGGLALHHPPDVLNFVLVDYKGGDAFATVADLPHTVSLITDLDRHLAARALLTLRSEIKRREHRLLEVRASGVTSLSEYQLRRGDREPMPFLVIVVDEFARLKDDLPEFINGLIDVARVGRSLGVHLILATQTPSGTVDDQIQKNTNFGVCLRVRDTGDSKQVIGEPDAALLPGSLPGRGYFRAGLEPVQLFQTARIGAAYEPRATHAAFEVLPFQPLMRVSRREAPISVAAASVTSEVRALVAHLRAAAVARGNVATPWPAPLPDLVALVGQRSVDPELATSALFTVPDPRSDWHWSSPPVASEWLVASIGLVDEPTQQAQGPFRLDVGRNCLVYGGAGSGKSTLLRTLVTSLAMTHSPRDLHVYCLDFDARTLGMLAGLPHCGESGVFFPRDTVRIRRLMRLLEHELVERREAGVTNLRQQRRAGGDPAFERFPFILVVLDNLAAFRETFEEEENLTRSMDSMLSDVASLMRDGPAAGIHFVVTTGATTSISNAITNAAEARIALRMTDSGDYGMVGRLEHLPEHVPPGRGFAPGSPPREFQVALLPDEFAQAEDPGLAVRPASSAAPSSVAASAGALRPASSAADSPGAPFGTGPSAASGFDGPPATPSPTDSPRAPLRTVDLFECLRRSAGDATPPAVHDLPRWLSLDDPRLQVPSRAGIPIVLGLDDERSQPVTIDLAELLHMLVLGPPGSGKTSLLAATILQVLNGPRGAAAELYLALPRPSPLSEFTKSARCHATARNVVQLGELLDDLDVVIDERREAMRSHGSDASTSTETETEVRPPVLLVLDDYELLRQDDEFLDLEMRLARLARRGTAVGLHVLVGGANIELRDARDDLVRYISQLRVGVLLQPDVEFDGDVFTVRLRRMVESAPVGRGYLVVRQQQTLFQSTTPQLEGESLAQSLRTRLANLA